MSKENKKDKEGYAVLAMAVAAVAFVVASHRLAVNASLSPFAGVQFWDGMFSFLTGVAAIVAFCTTAHLLTKNLT